MPRMNGFNSLDWTRGLDKSKGYETAANNEISKNYPTGRRIELQRTSVSLRRDQVRDQDKNQETNTRDFFLTRSGLLSRLGAPPPRSFPRGLHLR